MVNKKTVRNANPAAPVTVSLRFHGVSAPVALEGTADLLPAIETVFAGWPWMRLSRRSPKPAVISMTRQGNKYYRHSKWADMGLGGSDFDAPAEAMCNFVFDIIWAYTEERPGLLGIHASAVGLGSGLVVFPSSHKSGKSLLATHLVARGGVLFSDDVLLLPPRGRRGMATGIVPMLRLPVPQEKGSPLPAFISRAGLFAIGDYGWVGLRPGQVARLGERLPIHAVILLDRRKRADTKPRLDPMPRAEGLAKLIYRGFSLEARADDVLARLTAIAGKAQCFRLTYGSASKAADLLWETFSGQNRQAGRR